MFKLDKTLEKDTYKIFDLDFCELLLMNNADFPWLILVPKKPDLKELTDLNFDEQILVLKEINLVSQILQEKYKPHKINIAMLGNMVKQLHIHVIARFENDKAFPKPVWGVLSEQYQSVAVKKLQEELREIVVQKMSQKKQILYRSVHRGCKETDHLIGEFVKEKIDSLKDEELKLLENFIVEDDLLIYDWILQKIEAPQKYQSMIEKIQKFHNLVSLPDNN